MYKTGLLMLYFALPVIFLTTNNANTREIEEQIEDLVSEATAERIEQAIEELIDDLESSIDEDDLRIQTDSWLVMAEPSVFFELELEGFLFDQISDLDGLGFLLAEVAAPASFDLSETREGILEIIGSERADIDLNHLYTAGSPMLDQIENAPRGSAPRDLLKIPKDLANLPIRLGIIDSSVDLRHNAFAGGSIIARKFVANASPPNSHGTAIASIIVSKDPNLLGLAPEANLYAAEVFDQTDGQGKFASTVSLVKALDWLIKQDISVINISLAGPPNRLLESALNRVREKGIVPVAAAGNGGPMAEPMYPAAYPEVVAVTATDYRGRVFRLANRGEYVDIAAPGVNVLHAKAGGGIQASSGTSYAVPFVAVAMARLLGGLGEPDRVLDILYSRARDVGAPGRDEIYGYGHLQF